MTLTEAIQHAAENGLDGFTLFSTSKGWQASTRWDGEMAWGVCFNADPIKAALEALGFEIEEDELIVELDILG